AKVVAQAQRDGVPLSKAEQKMMYYSVSEPTIADEVSAQFPDDDPSYEKKIATLLNAAYNVAEDKESFKQAFQTLAQSDHYLSVMAPPGCVRAPGFLGTVSKFLATPTTSQRIQDRSGRDVASLFIS